MVEVKAPGKLMISGEYAVLEGAPCVAAAVNKYVYCSVKPWKGLRFRSKSLGLDWIEAVFDGRTLKWSKPLAAAETGRLVFAEKAMETALNYLKDSGKIIEGMAIETRSEETRADGKKVGFGSSAAAVVAIIGGILKTHDYNLMDEYAKEIVFKLGCLAHYLAQGKLGSGFDIACATYGGVMVYTRFDAGWLEKELKAGCRDVRALVEQKWPGFTQRWLLMPKDFTLLCAFTGKSASTKELVKKVNEWKAKNQAKYGACLDGLRRATERFIQAADAEDLEQMLAALGENRRALLERQKAGGAELETKELRMLAEAGEKAGAAGKLSGAGGGDCGIAVCFGPATAEKIKAGWREAGLKPLDITLATEGVD